MIEQRLYQVRGSIGADGQATALYDKRRQCFHHTVKKPGLTGELVTEVPHEQRQCTLVHVRYILTREPQCTLDQLARSITQPVSNTHLSRRSMSQISKRPVYCHRKVRHRVDQSSVEIKDDALVAGGRFGKAFEGIGRRQAKFS
ncbi:hypothetical protein GCM10010981_11180 [Dyella nitratireducens]|uniref:Transposase n=1 Tax=Dyella nitratireducens TaxID=1849580 RepID=A0ABQ1FQR8_9GAMM|nr:hypothetical protein GCM10010981_11180 [Dyella nitratireducens]GLQ43819.1 hypothetical protein GCM10007902_36690 [Dyella nitratireducens]